MREDRDALTRVLGFDEGELRKLGLWEPAVGAPEELAEAYIRRSKRHEDVATLRNHLRRMCEWATAHGLTIRRVWAEQVSASKFSVKRGAFEACTGAVMEGLSKTMIVWKTDRFDRRGMGAVGSMLDEFDRRRARLVCTTENLDSSTPGARMIFAMLAERARDEAKDIGVRVSVGLDAHKAMGRRGVGQCPYGLRSPKLPNGEPSGKVEHHPEEYPTARRIADMLLGSDDAEPMSPYKVAHQLNAEGVPTRHGRKWSPIVIRRMVASPTFAGVVPQSERAHDEYGNPLDKWSWNSVPALDANGETMSCGEGVITLAEYYRIAETISSRRTSENRGRRDAGRLATGILLCGLCGGPTTVSGASYRCRQRMFQGVSVCVGTSAVMHRVDEAMGRAWVAHISILAEEDPGHPALARMWERWMALSQPEMTAEHEHARVALKAAQGRVQALEHAYFVAGTMTQERFEELSQQQRATISTLRARLSTQPAHVSAPGWGDWIELEESWRTATVHTRRMLLRSALGDGGVKLGPAERRGRNNVDMLTRLTFDWAE